ncbi:MAG: molybdenum cofactor guanylyltransferase [Deltaproteobacteria bacterium]|nr:molybdenum cofactor guanylyltransferase [Deltaproteobacteria bacterium]
MSDFEEPVRVWQEVRDVGGIILAGGQSRRMGANKALLQINGQSLIDRVASVLRRIFPEVIIIGGNLGSPTPFNLPSFQDLRPGAGSLGGIYTGLCRTRFPRAFCVACDMPFLSAPLIHHLTQADPAADVVIPRTNEGVQPLHAVYSRKCIPFIRKLLEQNHFKIIDFFHHVRIREVGEKEMCRHGWKPTSFFNINTREDLTRALELAGTEGMEA